MPKILTVVGARPQFVKAATLTRAFQAQDGLSEVMVHTGQHFDPAMSSIFFEELGIPEPAYNLDIHGGGHGEMTGRMMIGLENTISNERPHAVMVYGDTNSTLAGALVAAKLHIPVIHIEAGLRSFNRRMPEEINRVMVDHLSDLLFCPTSTAVENLAREGITKGVHNVGDVMYDATIHIRATAIAKSQIIDRLGLGAGPYVVLTLHRADNTDDERRLDTLLRFVEREAQGARVVFPIHPRTKGALQRSGRDVGGLTLIEPVGYIDMHRLLAGASMVFTDSGGLQKEAYFHRVPCLTLREETEWVETVAAGWNRLWCVPHFNERREISEYGDGDAAGKIARFIRQTFASSEGVQTLRQSKVSARE